MGQQGWERIIRGAETAQIIHRSWQWRLWPPGYNWTVGVQARFPTSVGYDAVHKTITSTVTYWFKNGVLETFFPGY